MRIIHFDADDASNFLHTSIIISVLYIVTGKIMIFLRLPLIVEGDSITHSCMDILKTNYKNISNKYL